MYIYIYTLYCPVVQLTTTGSWPSGQIQTTLLYCYCNIVATNQLTHPYKGCMEYNALARAVFTLVLYVATALMHYIP